jgi:FdhE protein
MSLELKPHLKEVGDLYKKICEFESRVSLRYSYSPLDQAHYYKEEDIETVTEALSNGLEFTTEELEKIKDALYSEKIDFMRLTNDEGKIPEDEFQLLYIISRPYFKSLKNTMNMDNMFWQDGSCSVCGAKPSLSVIEKESQRIYYCSLCGNQGHYMRIGCPSCLSENPQDINIITLEGEEGMRADLCDKCKSYCKTFESSMIADHSIEYLDILSIPLDIIAQDKGYQRNSPNPVGIIKMG